MYAQIQELYAKYGQPLLTNFRLDGQRNALPCSAGVFALVDMNEQVVLIRRKPHVKHPGIERYWWLPGGGFQPGESIDDTAVRELKEETGLDICITKLLLAGIHKEKWFYFFFRGHVCGGTPSPYFDPDETTAEVRCFHPSEIPLQELWSDFDRIVLVQEGFLHQSVDELLAKHELTFSTS